MLGSLLCYCDYALFRVYLHEVASANARARLLGHKRIENTLKYVQLAEVQGDNEDFICKVATTMKQASELIEIGFKYVCTTPQEEMMFRKRK